MPRWSPRACREVTRISSRSSSLGTPRPSQRSKLCSTVSRTSWSRPTRSIRSSEARQWFSSIDSADPPALAKKRRERAPTRWCSGRPSPRWRIMNSGPGGGVGEVDLAEVAFECHLVSEPLSLLVGVDVAPNPGHERSEEDRLASRGRPGRSARPAQARSGIAEARAPSAGPSRDRRRRTGRRAARKASPPTGPRSSWKRI